ncbi:MAG: MoxR family ATPase [Anaerolineae bacterium]|nr:MoxR family ATPase [Anaerolineae bacterium]
MNFTEFSQAIQENISQVIIGKAEVTELMLVALLVEGHVLLEDVPGIGKTTLAKALARSLDCSFARIQFTPDLLPSDVTGLNIYNQKRQDFEFRPGPVLNQVLLADEINRATPRTQSSLLEAMQERQITVDGETYPLPRPFVVIATQNPIELEGTFPLPEAQVDRFLMQLRLGYPSLEEEDEILQRYQHSDPLINLRAVATTEDVLELQRQAQDIHTSTDVRNYILQVARTTREHEAVDLGVSPRGTMALFKASQALAALRGRDYVIPSDVQHLCPPILAHRIHISPRIRLRGRTPAQVVAEITDTVPVPVVE